MTPPRKYESLLEEYMDRQQGMWYWIAVDPLNRTCRGYIEKFIPDAHIERANLACDYAARLACDENKCEFCFLDSNSEKCNTLFSRFFNAVDNNDELEARKIAIEIADIPWRR